MGNPVATGWAIEVDGGEFDQLTGASVTPRAIIKAIRDTLIYFEAHQDAIFLSESSGENE
jgi:electron transport complex protein RnfG